MKMQTLDEEGGIDGETAKTAKRIKRKLRKRLALRVKKRMTKTHRLNSRLKMKLKEAVTREHFKERWLGEHFKEQKVRKLKGAHLQCPISPVHRTFIALQEKLNCLHAPRRWVWASIVQGGAATPSKEEAAYYDPAQIPHSWTESANHVHTFH